MIKSYKYIKLLKKLIENNFFFELKNLFVKKKYKIRG